MAFILVIGVLFISLLLYFGFFPLLYVSAHNRRLVPVMTMLGVCGLFIVQAYHSGAIGKLFILVLLGPSFLSGVILSWGAFNRAPFLHTVLRAFFPAVIIGLSVYLIPGVYMKTEGAIQQLIELVSEYGNQATNTQNKLSLPISPATSTLLFGILVSDMAFRLIVMAYLLFRIQAIRGLNLNIPHLKSVHFPDWPVWIVLAGMAFLISAYYLRIAPTFNRAAGLNILMCITPFYLLRGVKIILLMLNQKGSKKPWPNYLKFLWVLMIFLLWQILFTATSIIGLIDTWANFTGKLQKNESKT